MADWLDTTFDLALILRHFRDLFLAYVFTFLTLRLLKPFGPQRPDEHDS